MKEIMKEAVIVDVRTPEEFSQGAYPNAINIPLDRIPQQADELKKMQKPIVAYCRSGNRSGMAVSMLKQAGITAVYNGGGLQDLLSLN